MNSYIKSLARDYLKVIDQISHGYFSNSAELHALESERSILHAQLEAAIKRRIKKEDIPDYARKIIK